MAKVISWNIKKGNISKFAYIASTGETSSPFISDSQIVQGEADKIGLIVSDWGQEKYTTEFNRMKALITEQIGPTNIGNADKYYNVLGDENSKQVLMLVGADGRNIAEDVRPYTFHFPNSSIAVGTGDDYVLDKDVKIKVEAFFERDGEGKSGCDTLEIVGGNPTPMVSYVDDYTWEVTIPIGTTFDPNNSYVNEYTVIATNDVQESRVTFTVAAVIGGTDGTSYDIVLSKKSFHYAEEREVGDETVVVNVLRNGEKLNATEMRSENLSLAYIYGNGASFSDLDDMEPINVGGSKTASDIYENGGAITFYLIHTVGSVKTVVDSDSATVVVDGADGATVALIELSNEMAVIGVGDDTVLDLESPITVSTRIYMRYGLEECVVDNVLVTSISGLNDGKWSYATANTENYTQFEYTIKNGYELGSDYTDGIKLSVSGTVVSSSTQVHGECFFTIVGLRGGKDGENYELVPSCDFIVYDPNSGEASPAMGSAITATIQVNSRIRELDDDERLKYSIGNVFTSASLIYDGGTGIYDYNPSSGVSVGDIVNNADSVTFYWVKNIDGEYLLLDRETIPVVRGGINGSTFKINLDNEIEPISTGEDFILDIDPLETVVAGTSVRVTDGTLADLIINSISLEELNPPSDQSQQLASYNPTTGRVSERKVEFHYSLTNGFDFGSNGKRKVRVTVTFQMGEEEYTGYTVFSIVSVPGGSEGKSYRLVPEHDVIKYSVNSPILPDFNLTCMALYSLEEFTEGHIYYTGFLSDKVLATLTEAQINERLNRAPSSKEKWYRYPSNGVPVADCIERGWDMIAFYLTIDADGNGTHNEMIVDHETTTLVSDGKNADPYYAIELTNEIESFATGDDTTLGDMPAGTTADAETDVIVYNGGVEIPIIRVKSVNWVDTNSAVTTDPGVSECKAYHVNASDSTDGRSMQLNHISSPNSNEMGRVRIRMKLNNQFDFTDKLNRQVIIEVGYKDGDSDEKFARGIITLTGIRGGKDGIVYRLAATPSMVLYDFDSNDFGTPNLIECTASIPDDTPYKIYYTDENYPIYDLDAFTPSEAGVHEYTHALQFNTPSEGGGSGQGTRDQRRVFYLWVDGQCMDREMVPLIISGKNGKDGHDGVDGDGSILFDLSDNNICFGIGDNHRLDGVSVSGSLEIQIDKNGTWVAPVNVKLSTTAAGWRNNGDDHLSLYDGSNVVGYIFVSDMTDRPKQEIFYYFFDGFYFPENNKIDISVEIKITDPYEKTAVLNLSIIGIPGGSEGVTSKIMTNVKTVYYLPPNASGNTSAVYSPNNLHGELYEEIGGSTNGPLTGVTWKYRKYKTKSDGSTEQVGSEVSYSASRIDIGMNATGSSPIGVEFGYISLSAYTENGSVFRDCEQVGIARFATNGKDGSGIVLDLSNDRDTIALGENMILLDDAPSTVSSVTLGPTIATVFNGTRQENLTGIKVNTSGVTQSSSIKLKLYCGPSENALTALTENVKTLNDNSVSIWTKIDRGFNFGQLTDGRFDVTITISASTDGTTVEKSVKYSVLGFKGGKDGHAYNLHPNVASIRRSTNGNVSTYVPNVINSPLYEGMEEMERTKYTLKYKTDNASSGTEITGGGTSITLSTLATAPLSSVTFLGYSTGTPAVLIDEETIPIVYDGEDGVGAPEVKTNTDRITVNINENGYPKREVSTIVDVWLASGDTVGSSMSIEKPGGITCSDNHQNNVHHVTVTIPTTYQLGTRAEIKFTLTATSDSTVVLTKIIEVVGSSGIKGDQGATGEAGKSIRVSVWSGGTQYYNGTTAAPDGIVYLDIVTRSGMSIGTEGVSYYSCKTNNNDSTFVQSHWDTMENKGPLVSPLIFAQKLKSNFIDVEDLLANNAFINNLYAKHLDSADGTFYGGIRVPYADISIDPIPQYDDDGSLITPDIRNVQKNHILLNKNDNGTETAVIWELSPSGAQNIMIYGNSYGLTDSSFIFETGRLDDWNGRKMSIRLACGILSATQAKVFGTYTGPGGFNSYIQPVRFLHDIWSDVEAPYVILLDRETSFVEFQFTRGYKPQIGTILYAYITSFYGITPVWNYNTNDYRYSDMHAHITDISNLPIYTGGDAYIAWPGSGINSLNYGNV